MIAQRSTPLLIVAAVLLTGALYLSRSVLEPVAFALFAIALAAPLQTRLARSMPAGLALLLTVIITLGVGGLLVLIIIWGIGEIGHWVVLNVPRFQATYSGANVWLEENDLFFPGLLSERFDVGWITGPLRYAAAGMQGSFGFIMLAFVFAVLGLKEAPEMPARIRRITGPDASWDPVATAVDISRKFRRYMAVRTLASLLTGVATAVAASVIGVEQPVAWGVLAFAFNFLPFLGSLIVVTLMTIFTAAQFVAWQEPLIVLVTVSTIQFGIGSYLEPVLAGTALAMSPFMVLLAVFFWGLVWGIPGAFLGVPIMIMLLTICNQWESTRWITILLSPLPPGPR